MGGTEAPEAGKCHPKCGVEVEAVPYLPRLLSLIAQWASSNLKETPPHPALDQTAPPPQKVEPREIEKGKKQGARTST